MAIGTATAILGGAAIGSAVLGANASKSAARAQADASRRATDVQERMYQQSRDDLAPWREKGVEALNKYSDIVLNNNLAGFKADPGYQFRLSEGQKAMDRLQAQRGNFLSGEAYKEMERYSQDYASGEFQNVLNRYGAIAGIGQTATQQTGALGAQSAAGQAASIQNQGAAVASGKVGAANAYSNAFDQFGYAAGRGAFGPISPTVSPSNFTV